MIKQSKIANDDRCKILISSLQDTLKGIEDKSYGQRFVSLLFISFHQYFNILEIVIEVDRVHLANHHVKNIVIVLEVLEIEMNIDEMKITIANTIVIIDVVD